ncbi:MAG: SDR family oxidoreductase [Acidobacteria bacterium]|nr:SDR family oxidoreductase [Acidobacteriota bacterium]
MALLDGKVAVVTGGNVGIGLATAKRFAAEGAYVFICGRRQSELDKAAAEIGENVSAVPVDVSKLEDLDRLYAEVGAAKGGIDVLFANAGILETVTLADSTPEHFDRTFDINARGAYFTVQKALPLLRDGASIILTSSVVWTKGFPAYGAYTATKAAVRSYVRTWSSELSKRGIRANVISPGPIETAMFGEQFPTKEAEEAGRKQFMASVPLGRIGRPEEIASAAVFLASDESSYITGIDLPVDGGLGSV